ncbi:pre-mRNA splicing factor [Grosmannia clavigera kw1407]|uniref:Pre-mRNA splicing factor n=1 Tax=Grosmannia clavigera (strain kw1407 / UAMH 11150) TaxID=655863 RepID=F0XTA6_GROCL|nr:pre-mRNA splicing factor [Grosmannia clavigera kw1407]EFW99232.1 pre-mRNA splicing factor [Grosmannia clavigera kw1407]
MARNAEKAQSMLYRFRESQAADLGILDAGRTRRPKVISEQTSVSGCERWRGQVLKEISRKVSRIQESTLSDFQIRDLNDEINKLLREKHMWEVQIRNLGGPNYARQGTKEYDEDGREIPGGGKGYRYFGRARELPGVRELFEAARARSKKDGSTGDDGKPLEDRDDLRKDVDAAYYGYGPDEEDAVLLAYEAGREAEAQERLAAAAGLAAPDDGGEKSGDGRPPPDWEALPGDTGDGKVWLLPTAEEVQQELLERRKQRILQQL